MCLAGYFAVGDTFILGLIREVKLRINFSHLSRHWVEGNYLKSEVVKEVPTSLRLDLSRLLYMARKLLTRPEA